MSEPVIIALEVYFLGFVIAMVMAAIIKLILYILHRGKKNPGGAAEGESSSSDEQSGQGDQKEAGKDEPKDSKKREEGAA